MDRDPCRGRARRRLPLPGPRPAYPIVPGAARMAVIAALLAPGIAVAAEAPPLTLEEAEVIALASDPRAAALERRGAAARARAAAAEALPDPELKLGALALPIDTFALDQEPMTQLQVGLVQAFPRGASRRFRRSGHEAEGARQDALAAEARADVLLALRTAWIDGVLQRRLIEALDEGEALLAALRELAEAAYASGRASQQEVQQAALELLRLDARRLTLLQAEEAARARLARWLGERATEARTTRWPRLPGDTAAPAPHPRERAAELGISTAQAGLALAREQYKPGVAVELAYGERSGEDLAGRARPDFLAAMVRIDLPVFRSRRWDGELTAAELDAEAARLAHDDVRRALAAARLENERALDLARRRAALFTERLLPEAAANAQLALDAYRATTGDVEALLRARLAALEVRMDAERARAELARLEAERAWLAGDGS